MISPFVYRVLAKKAVQENRIFCRFARPAAFFRRAGYAKGKKRFSPAADQSAPLFLPQNERIEAILSFGTGGCWIYRHTVLRPLYHGATAEWYNSPSFSVAPQGARKRASWISGIMAVLRPLYHGATAEWYNSPSFSVAPQGARKRASWISGIMAVLRPLYHSFPQNGTA